MNNLNSLIIEGNITAFEKCPSDIPSLTMQIETSRAYRNGKGEYENEKQSFVVIVYGELAEKAETNCKLGRDVRVLGRLSTFKYKDTNGKQSKAIGIIAKHIDFKPLVVKNA